MSDANRISIAAKVQADFDTFPSSTFSSVLLTGESLEQTTRTVQSATIRNDRNIVDNPRVSTSGQGDVNMEVLYGNHDVFMDGIMLNTSPKAAVTVGPKSLSVSGAIITGAAADFSGFAVNDIFRWKDGAAAAEYFKCVAVAGDGSTITADRNPTAAGGSGDEDVKRGVQHTNGTDLAHYGMERAYADLTSEAARYTGFAPNTFGWTMPLEGLMTMAIGFLGKNETTNSATQVTADAAVTTLPMNTIDHVHTFLINGTSYGLLSFDTSWQNNLRLRPQMATLGPISLGTGQFQASGAFEAYFDSGMADVIDLYLAYTTIPIFAAVEDSAGNAYVMDLPSVNLSAGRRNTPGANQDVPGAFQYLAKMDATELITARFSAIAA